MLMRKGMVTVVLGVALPVVASLASGQEAKHVEREAMLQRYQEFSRQIRASPVQIHWMADGSSFWYAEGEPARMVIYKVDAKANTKRPLFDVARLRTALAGVLVTNPPYQGLPFQEFTFLDGEKAVRFSVGEKEFLLQLDTYDIAPAPVTSKEETSRFEPRSIVSPDGRQTATEPLSPDRRWFAGVKDYDLYVRSTDDGRSQRLTDDGIERYSFRVASWSPDSRMVAVRKLDVREVNSIPVVHWLRPKVEVEWVTWARADGPLARTELFVVDVVSKRRIRIDTGDLPDQPLQVIGWRPDGAELYFLRSDREYKRLDLIAADPITGASRTVLTETSNTFVRGIQYNGWHSFTLLANGRRFIWMSERDGWNHLYLYNADGSLVRRLTAGTFPLESVVAVDERAGWVYFTAHADLQRPYDTHLYRVTLEGTGFTRLTDATGRHNIQFAPSKEFFVDTHSSVSRPPTTEVRTSDGRLRQVLSRANVDDRLAELQWTTTEEFVVKADDGKTDLHGILYKPYDFRPDKMYPVIDFIYAGPNRSQVLLNSRYGETAQHMAQLGFVTFIVDGRGTPGRGKEFQDVVYGHLGRYEIPDHVAALKQLAGKRPYMDLNRVGIAGVSWGGHFAVRAMLQAPDVYHVGVAGAPDTDLYDHLPNDIETWLGQPQKNREAYDYGSNYWLADRLKGKLLLVHGTGDVNVPFAVTMRMVDAFVRAGKFFDLMVIPEGVHNFGGYSQDVMRRYFQEHLKPE